MRLSNAQVTRLKEELSRVTMHRDEHSRRLDYFRRDSSVGVEHLAWEDFCSILVNEILFKEQLVRDTEQNETVAYA